MLRILLRIVVTAVALGVAVWAVPGLEMVPYADQTQVFVGAPTLEVVVSYLIVAAIFGVVNAVVGNAIRIVAFPLYILTLGLLALVVNGVLLLIVQQVSQWIGFGLSVASFGTGVLGAVVLSLTTWLIGLVFRPLLSKVES
jgi:putative membrane protein